jgi:hypothetical protein
MTRYSDDEGLGFYKKGPTNNEPQNLAKWLAATQRIKKLENDSPELRDHLFVADRLAGEFISIVQESGGSIPEDCRKKIAGLVFLFDKPLVAAEVVQEILNSFADPSEGLEKAVRLAKQL